MHIGPRVSGLLAFIVLLLVAGATAWEQQPHGHRPESAPVAEFSAARAMRIVEEIAQRPHPVGTPEHDRVRDHLAGELRALGLDTEIQEGIGRYPTGVVRDVLGMGRVANIIARLPGTNSTGTVFLTAHYDSVVSGPGANDDGVGVAAILETVRALRAAGTTVRNDVVVLLTDGEEPGLLGAEAFVAAGMDGRKIGVVVNHEARGAGGPVLMWRVTHPDGALVRAVANAAPHPNTDSLTTTLAGAQTSSNTDFASFEPGGLRVLDWAYAGRSAYYHNRFDDPAHVDPATVQQMGDNSLALVRELGDDDLAAADDVDRVYFQLPFGVLIVVPIWVIFALAVATVVVVTLVVRQFLRAGETSLRRVLGSGATALLTAPIATGAVYGMWELLKVIRPEYRPLFVDPYRPEFFYVAILAVSAAVLFAWFALARRLFGADAAAAGLLSCLALLGGVLTALAPTTGHLLVVPTFAAAVGVGITFAAPERWRLPLLTVFLIPAAIFLGSATWPALQTGITTAPFLVAPAVALVGGLLLLTLTKTWPAQRGWVVPGAALLLAIALAASGLAVDRFDERHPLTSQLVYAFDADRNEAQWISRETPDRWTRELVGPETPGPRFTRLWPNIRASGPAPVAALLPPVAEILSDTTASDQRTVKLRIRSQRDATIIDLRYETAPRSLRVAGREVNDPPAKGIHFNAPAREGIEIELTAPAGPLALDVVDYTYLPDSRLTVLPPVPGDIYFRQDSSAAVFTAVRGL
ncbi:M20/M25/M40 family metallo-hydrolase [Nocardia brasiliensis]|uniref:M20/M25/M40 family metallo-hydrolase n=1 Tax=Nocardia brasiliensis TaxID=37326 RepID=UPI0024579D65|nr:M20/M25/M40 family metallo-hydrolase [Nocardia brasiliensis]